MISSEIIGLLSLVAMIVILMLGINIGTSLVLVGFVGSEGALPVELPVERLPLCRYPGSIRRITQHGFVPNCSASAIASIEGQSCSATGPPLARAA